MQTKIIIGYEGSEDSKDALALGRVLAAATGAELILAGVYPHFRVPVKGDGGAYENVMANDMREALAGADVPAGTELRPVAAGSVPHGLHDLAEETGAQVIVLGSRQRRAGRIASRLLHGAPCAVAVAPGGFRDHVGGIERVIVGYDGRSESEAALDAGISLARACGASLRLVGVLDRLGGFGEIGYVPGREAIARELGAVAEDTLRDALARVPAEIESESELLDGDAGRLLREQGTEARDLLLVGSRGYGRIGQVLLGSVSSELLRHAEAPVLVLPRGERSDLFGATPSVTATGKSDEAD